MRIQFGPFIILNLETRQLTRDNREIHLAPKAFELLAALALDRPKVLSKAELQTPSLAGHFRSRGQSL